MPRAIIAAALVVFLGARARAQDVKDKKPDPSASPSPSPAPKAPDHDRAPTPETDRGGGAFNGPGIGSTETPKVSDLASHYDPSDEWPMPGEVPGPATPQESEPGEGPRAGALEGVDLRADGKVRLELGYDSNVFRSPDRTRKGDGFFHGLGEVEALARLKDGRELFASVSAEGIAYFVPDTRADEMNAASFAEYFHPLAEWLDVGVQNTLEYSRQNLLDDNGDLLPRENFNAIDEEPHGFAIFHAADELSLELGAGYRWKFFEWTDLPGSFVAKPLLSWLYGEVPPFPGFVPRVAVWVPAKPSLDFVEVRADAAIRARIPWWDDGKVKVKYRFRDRHYRQLRADDRDGINPDSDLRAFLETPPDNTRHPLLEIVRHQFNFTYAQKLHPLTTEMTVTFGYAFTYNQDTFENDRSYREHAGSLRLEWWLVKDSTRLEAEIRGGSRDFLVRRVTPALPPNLPPGTGPLLRQRFIDSSVLIWQKLVDHLALVAEAAWFDWGSTEHLESYDRFVVQAGIEGSF